MGLFSWLTGNAEPDRSRPALRPAELIDALLALNDEKRSWQVRDARADTFGPIVDALARVGLTHPADLIASWKSERADVAQQLVDVGVSPGFAVLLRLDQAALTVRSVDHDAAASASPTGGRLSASFFRGQARMTGASATYRRNSAGAWVTTAATRKRSRFDNGRF